MGQNFIVPLRSRRQTDWIIRTFVMESVVLVLLVALGQAVISLVLKFEWALPTFTLSEDSFG